MNQIPTAPVGPVGPWIPWAPVGPWTPVGPWIPWAPEFQKKSILYICYNDIVRNTVSQLCTTHDIDIKFWFANFSMCTSF